MIEMKPEYTADKFPVLECKGDVAGMKLSVVDGVQQTAQRYNSMEYAKSAALIAEEVFGVSTP